MAIVLAVLAVSALASQLIDGTCLANEANCGPTGDISPFSPTWVELPSMRIAPHHDRVVIELIIGDIEDSVLE